MRSFLQFDVPFRTQQFIVLAAQTGNFRSAAKCLGIDPSLVARSIDQVEQDLGARIFDRDRHHFRVKPGARLFIHEIQEAILHVERACDSILYHTQLEHGPFHLGYSAYVHSKLIPVLETLDLSAELLQQSDSERTSRAVAPFVESGVVLESGSTLRLVEGVLRGRLHAAFGVLPITAEDLWVKSIIREPFCLCISKNHRLARQPSVLAKDLDGEVVFFLPRVIHPELYDRTLEYIERTGAKPVLREVLSVSHTMEIVTRNLGVALLPRSVSHLSHMGVLFKPVSDKLLWIETALFLRRDYREERTQWLLNTLLTQLKDDASQH
jgi:DNA-binding transcriptional LysR family regulator